jgi:positive regulator of sigma E activity
MSALETIATVGVTLTALLGVIVASLALRGYRRNDSPVMRGLGVGIVAIAVIPFVVVELLAPLLSLTDAQALLWATLSHTVGLLAIYRTFGY